jgi:hypothetical protein
MKLIAALFVVLTISITGCSTAHITQVAIPGAVGRVIDATTGTPVKGARITRPYMHGRGWKEPAVTVTSNKSGDFDLAPASYFKQTFTTRIINIRMASFIISADGYATNEVRGVVNDAATSDTLWQVNLGQVSLTKQ